MKDAEFTLSESEIDELIKQSGIDEIENAIEKTIKYARHLQKDYMEGEGKISGTDFLGQLLQNGTIKLSIYQNLIMLVANPEMGYTIKRI